MKKAIWPSLIILIIALSLAVGQGFLTPSAWATAGGDTVQSTSSNIAAFAKDWSWSRNRDQDGEYGEAKVTFSSSLPANIASATLTISGSYSQMAGSANAEIYIKTSQQVTPKDDDHDYGTRWYGDVASVGTNLGTYTTTYSGSSQEFDATSYVSSNPATTYYIAVKNLARADIGISTIRLNVTEGSAAPTLKSNGEFCSSASECENNYCLRNTCRSSSTHCGDSYCDTGETCTSCSDDCGVCKKADGASCNANTECENNYCVHGICRSTSTYCGDSECDSGETCTSCSSDCGACEQETSNVTELTFNEKWGSGRLAAVWPSYVDYNFTITIPSSFTGSKVLIDTPDSSLVSPRINLCSSSSCEVSASAGQTITFEVTARETDVRYEWGYLSVIVKDVPKKSDGSSCTAASECSGGHCVHSKCRSDSTYCGDSECDTGETCTSCSGDCGTCKKADGESCSANTQCENNYCVHGTCRSSSTYCGDSECDTGETCTSCSGDCGACAAPKPTRLTFTTDGIKDGGVVTYLDGAYTWTVTIPDNFVKVETAHYDRPTPNTIKKYMGWNGYLKVNGQKVWEFRRWSAATGGEVYDYTTSNEVYESSGNNRWLDVTQYFNAGSNTVTYYHYTEGDGIGFKIKLTTGEIIEKVANGQTCTENAECESENCRDSICCRDGELCCKSDSVCPDNLWCKPDGWHYCRSQLINNETCARDRQCQGGHCIDGECHSAPISATSCGDGACDTDETCSSCPGDCGECEVNPTRAVLSTDKQTYTEGETVRFRGSCDAGVWCNIDLDTFSDGKDLIADLFEQHGAERCQEYTVGGELDLKPGTHKVQSWCCNESKTNCASSSWASFTIEEKEAPEPTEAPKKDNDKACQNNGDCKSNNCVEDVCRYQGYTWCGDNTCQKSERCTCQDCRVHVKCKKPMFYFWVKGPEDIKAGENKSFSAEIENKTADTLSNIKIKMYPGRGMTSTLPECKDKVPCEITVGSIDPYKKQKIGDAFLTFKFQKAVENTKTEFRIKASNSTGTKSTTITQQTTVSVSPVTLEAILSPTSITGEAGDLQKVELKLSAPDFPNVDREQIKVKIYSDKPEVAKVSFRRINDQAVKRLGHIPLAGVAYGFPKTITFFVDLRSAGFANIFVDIEGKNFERVSKRISVDIMSLPPSLNFKVSPSGLIMVKGERKEVTLTLHNDGKGTAYKPRVDIEQSTTIANVEGRSLPIYFDSVAPGKSIKKTVKIRADETGKGSFEFKASYALEPPSPLDHANYKFKENQTVHIGIDAEEKICQDNECERQTQCLVELSNTAGCAAEIADIIPYLDKPTAVVLAASDFCEIKTKAERGDPIGAALTTALAAIDIGDNAGEAVPIAGNVASAAIDTIEGSIDCLEGFFYDFVDDYCAGPDRAGYTGCLENLVDGAAYITGEAYEAGEAFGSILIGIIGSPVSFKIVDNDGIELGPSDGIFIVEKGDLKTFIIKNPENLTNGYNVELIGTGDGTYKMHTALVSDGRVVAEQRLDNQPIKRTEGANLALAVQQDDEGVTGFSVAGAEAETVNRLSKKLEEARARESKYKWIMIIGGIIILVLIALSVMLLLRKQKRKSLVG